MRMPTLGIVLVALFSATALQAQQPVSLERTLVRADLTVPENQSTKVLEQAKLPDTKPDNFDTLTAQLLNDANSDRSVEGTRGGLIVQGEKAASKIQVVKFTTDPTPVMSLTITYYKK